MKLKNFSKEAIIKKKKNCIQTKTILIELSFPKTIVKETRHFIKCAFEHTIVKKINVYLTSTSSKQKLLCVGNKAKNSLKAASGKVPVPRI
jgi:hypothetical protein